MLIIRILFKCMNRGADYFYSITSAFHQTKYIIIYEHRRQGEFSRADKNHLKTRNRGNTPLFISFVDIIIIAINFILILSLEFAQN